jgi:hypothetical protein
VVIGLELLSLACPGLGLGSDIVTSFMLVSSCCCLFDPINVENRIWGDGFGTTFGGFQQFGALSGGLRKPVVDIIPKYKDRFMERPPMKIVQP